VGSVRPQRGSRDELVLRYTPLVRAVVRKLSSSLPPHVSREDLEGYGLVGLLEALDRYDPGHGVRFETFAWHRIRGAILDHLRSLDLAARSDRQRLRRIEQAQDRLQAQLGREPTREELAAAVGLEPDQLDVELGRLHGLVVASFEELVRQASVDVPAPSDGPEEVVEQAEVLDALRRGLVRLSERERVVLGLYYYEGLSLSEIGAVLDLTESRVCQIQAAALVRLRAFLMQEGFGR
jgi:RNA polymerase sigma factor for flagellar operon FliA